MMLCIRYSLTFGTLLLCILMLKFLQLWPLHALLDTLLLVAKSAALSLAAVWQGDFLSGSFIWRSMISKLGKEGWGKGFVRTLGITRTCFESISSILLSTSDSRGQESRQRSCPWLCLFLSNDHAFPLVRYHTLISYFIPPNSIWAQ